MARTTRIAGIPVYYLYLVPVIVALVFLCISIGGFMAYLDPVHADGAPAILSTSFEDWRAGVHTRPSELLGNSDSTGHTDISASAASDSTLKGVYDALKIQALSSQKHRLVMAALQPAIVSILSFAICVGLWCWLRGTPILLQWLLVVLVPIVCVGFGGWAFWAATNRAGQFLQEPMVAAWQAIWVAAPFLILALVASRRRSVNFGSQGVTLAWILGIALTIGFYWLFYYEGYTYWRDEGSGGANIGLGLLMLASPVLTGGGMFLGYRVGARYQKAVGNSSSTAAH